MTAMRSESPFARAAMDYALGTDIGGVIPIYFTPGATKKPLVGKYSGRHENWATPAQVRAWLKRKTWHHTEKNERGKYIRLHEVEPQIGLRLHKDIVGIDLDLYKGPEVHDVVVKLQRMWGPLPDAWASTSRSDGSGIRLYRLPEGVDSDRFRNPAEGIDVVRWRHRFVTVYPTLHPREGRPPYGWWTPDGFEAEDEIPERANLDYLPEGWCVGLGTGRLSTPEGCRIELPTEMGPVEWLREISPEEEALCRALSAQLDQQIAAVRHGLRHGGAHDAMNRAVFQLIGDATEGHAGGFQALRRLGAVFLEDWDAKKRQRARSDGKAEFFSSMRGGIECHGAKLQDADGDPCSYIGTLNRKKAFSG